LRRRRIDLSAIARAFEPIEFEGQEDARCKYHSDDGFEPYRTLGDAESKRLFNVQIGTNLFAKRGIGRKVAVAILLNCCLTAHSLMLVRGRFRLRETASRQEGRGGKNSRRLERGRVRDGALAEMA